MPPVWKPIKKIIKKPIKWIGDKIEDIGDWVVDEIIDPIVSTVESTIDAMLDDPIKTIATIALVATGNAWALPLLEGADVAANGGDIGDILEATAKAYVAQQVGAAVGNYAGSAAQGAAQASTSAATAKIVGQVVAKGTSNAVGAIVYGQDPAEAFLKGGIQAGVSAGLGKLAENTDFKNLPQAAKNVIETSLTAALTGEDITPAMIASAVTKAYVTTEAVGKYFDPSLNDDWDEEQMSSMSDGQIAAITNGILNTANAAFTGGDVPKAILDSVMKYGSQELNKIMDKTIKNTIDKVSGNYKTTEDKAQEIDDALDDYEAAAANYNVTADEMKPRFDERARLKGTVEGLKVKLQNQDPGSNVDTANRDKYQAILNEYNASVKTYNSYATQLDNDYTNKYKPLLDKYKTEADTAYNNIEPLKKDYMKLKELLISSADQLDDALKPMQAATDKAFVTAMVGEDFNVEEYAKLNGLDDGGETGEEIDPYYHWLTTGKDENLPVNAAQYKEQYTQKRSDLLNESLNKSGLNLSNLTKAQQKTIIDNFDANYDTLQSLNLIDTDTLGLDISKNYLIESINNSAATQAEKNESINSVNSIINGKTSAEDKFNNIKTVTNNIKVDSGEVVAKAAGVTDEDIAENRARIRIHEDGLVNWDDISGLSFASWNSEYNTLTKRVPHPDSPGAYALVDANTGAYLGKLDANGSPELRIRIPRKGQTLEQLRETDPVAWAKQVNSLSYKGGKALNTVVNAVKGDLVDHYELVKSIYKYASEETELGKNVVNSAAFKNFSGIAAEATGELLTATNTMLILANINPASTPLGKAAREMIALGGDQKTPEWKAAKQAMDDKIGGATGFVDTTLAIFGSLADSPTVFLSEIIGKEILQEIPILVVSGGVGNVAKKFALEAGEAYAKKIAAKVSIGTAISLDAVEAFGGTADGAFDDAYATALKSGMTEAEASAFAKDVAIRAGTTAVMASFVTNKVGGPAMEKAIFGGKKNENFREAFSAFSKNVGKESAGEGVEEFAAQGIVELSVYGLDPDRDIGGNLSNNTILGILAGGGTSSTLMAGKGAYNKTGDFVSNVIANTNFEVNKVLKGYDGTPESLKTAETQLIALGYDTDNIIKTNLLNIMSPSDYTSSGDVIEAFKNVKGVYTPTDGEQNQFVGESSDADFATVFNEYVDKGTVDKQEVLQLAVSEGITLTDEQVTELIGQKPEETFLIEQQKIFDPQAVTKEEATKFLADQGYNPTEEEVLSFVAQVEESKQQAAIQKYSEDRLTTKDEAIAYLESLGLDTAQLPNEFIDSFVKQGLQTDTEKEIVEAADPYYVDKDEVLAQFRAAGLPDVRPEDVDKLVGQYSESDLEGKINKALRGAQYNVLKYNIGAPSTEDTPATGIFKQLEELQASGATQDEAIQALSEQLNLSVEELTNQISTVEAGLQEQIFDVGDQVSDVEDQLTKTEASLTQQIQQLVDAGATQDEAIQALSDKLGISVEDLNSQITGIETKLGQKITDVETGLTEQITDVETGLTEQITDVETGLTSEITAIADIIGKPVGEVTDVDIDFVTDLIAQQTALTDPSTFEFTPDMLQYDVTGDGKVDAADQTMLQNAMQGQDVQFAQDSKFGPTGVFDTIADTKTDLTQQISDTQTDIETMFTQQAEEDNKRRALAAQKQQRMGNLEQLYTQIQPQQVDVKGVELANIGPQYDFGSIFRDSGQQSFYKTPYRKGGQVDNINDRLLKLIGDS
jgi:hypothetical protein